MRFCQNILLRFWVSFSQNLIFFHFFCRIILLMSRTVTIFLLTQRTRLDGSFKYLAHSHKVCRKFSRWHKVALCRREKSVKIWLITDEITRQKKRKDMRFWKYIDKLRLEYSYKPHFLRWNFFKSSYKIFCGVYVHVHNIWKAPPNLDLWFDEKIVTARHTKIVTWLRR